MPLDRNFAGVIGQACNRARLARSGRHVDEQIIDRICANYAQHGATVGGG